MAEFVLELFSEEIPARMQLRAAEDLKRIVTEKLKAAQLAFTRAEAFVTPRRLTLVVDGLPERQPDVTEEKRGPRVGAPDQAIQGFLKANNLASLDQCEKRDAGKGEFWFAIIHRKGEAAAEIIKKMIGEILTGLPWPKSMLWGVNRSLPWVRPLHNVAAVFAGKPLAGVLKFGDTFSINISGATAGHRFLAPQPFAITSFADYQRKLHKAHVVLDHAERQKLIREQAEKLARAEGLTLKEDPGLVEEVAGLTEWPQALIGRIDEAYMGLPPEVLTTAMRAHQRYFALTRPDGALAPRFIVVANIDPADDAMRQTIVSGNERVLRARLSDAKFFWDQDRKRPLESRVPALKDIVFHAKLGTLADKVARIQALAAEIAPMIGADLDMARSAATLAKADLTTGMVGEFPELQGVMGRYYALHERERSEVANAIAEHYAPQGPSDRCPTAPVSVAVALADKIDTLVGFFTVDERPTGSKDPFALRRAALGVIRLILENKLRLPLRKIFVIAGASDKIANDLLAFFADRLKVHLRESRVRHDLVSAVFALDHEDDLVRLLARVDALKAFLATEDGANLLTAYNRAANIVRIEEKKDGAKHDGIADPALLRQTEEKELASRLVEVRQAAEPALAAERFGDAMAALSRLRRPVDAFFDKVTVNCDEPPLRLNRLKLLSQIRATMGAVADFSQIEGQ